MEVEISDGIDYKGVDVEVGRLCLVECTLSYCLRTQTVLALHLDIQPHKCALHRFHKHHYEDHVHHDIVLITSMDVVTMVAQFMGRVQLQVEYYRCHQ